MLHEGRQPTEDVRFVGERAGFVFAEEQVVVDFDVEDAAAAADELRSDTEGAFDFGRQTGGAGEVVSLHAVGNGHDHGFLLDLSVNGGRRGERSPQPGRLDDRGRW